MKKTEKKPSAAPIVATFIALTVCICLLGIYVYQRQKEGIKSHQYEMLSAIAEEKVKQISSWRKERIYDANLLAQNNAFAVEVKKYFSGDQRAKDIIENTLSSLYRNAQYISIILLDKKLKPRWSLGYRGDRIGQYARNLIRKSLTLKEAIMSDFHEFPDLARIHLDMAVPLIINEGGLEEVVGAVIMRIDPATFLYPTIQSWPMPSDSAETLMVRKEGNEVIFLNELRFSKGAALKMKRKLTEHDIPAVKAALGFRGFVQGRDYRGVEVLAFIQEVPDTPWLAIAKIDLREIYYPINRMAIFIGVSVLAIIMACALGLWMIWSRQMMSHYEITEKRRALSHHCGKYGRCHLDHGHPIRALCLS